MKNLSFRMLLGVFAATLLGLGTGCERRVSALPEAPASATGLAERLGAAQAIFDSGKRDEALRAVAEAAAAAGDYKVVQRALDGMFDSGQRDAAASASALALAKLGRLAEARQITGRIFDSAKRDETLLKLAKG